MATNQSINSLGALTGAGQTFTQSVPTTSTAQQYLYPYQTSIPGTASESTKTHPSVEVPIITKWDSSGIFLQDKEGKLQHISTERLMKAFGIDW